MSTSTAERLEYPPEITRRVTAQHSEGGWFVFIDGRVFASGLARSEVNYHRRQAYERLAEITPQPAKGNPTMNKLNATADVFSIGPMIRMSVELKALPLVDRRLLFSALLMDREVNPGYTSLTPEQSAQFSELLKAYCSWPK